MMLEAVKIWTLGLELRVSDFFVHLTVLQCSMFLVII